MLGTREREGGGEVAGGTRWGSYGLRWAWQQPMRPSKKRALPAPGRTGEPNLRKCPLLPGTKREERGSIRPPISTPILLCRSLLLSFLRLPLLNFSYISLLLLLLLLLVSLCFVLWNNNKRESLNLFGGRSPLMRSCCERLKRLRLREPTVHWTWWGLLSDLCLPSSPPSPFSLLQSHGLFDLDRVFLFVVFHFWLLYLFVLRWDRVLRIKKKDLLWFCLFSPFRLRTLWFIIWIFWFVPFSTIIIRIL